uniref:F5/8 type C domain-containing protein n=1 Tax=Ciona savignyi TaxID=51511 RepID=H2YA65_CIOSA
MECAECLVGMWEGWSSWSRCSTSCGSGVMSRERSCLNGTAGVSGCPGDTESFGQCNQHSCPAWSAWKPWSVCSASCGNSGVRARSRDCYDDSIGDIVTDSSCGQGAATEIETCGRGPCPVWSSWGRWGSCSVSCGVGWSERTRLCRNGTVGDMGCHIGKSLDKKVCNTWDCPSTCDVTELEVKNRTLTPDALFAASSEMVGCEAYNARLNGDLAWCPTTNDTKRWIQVDLTTPMEVTGISVQGFVNNNRVKKAPKYSWVSRFGVLYYDESTSLFDAVRDNAGRARLFSGLNSPVSTDNRHWNSIKSRIWKIQVLDTSPTRHGCLRFELLTCQGNPIMGRSSEAGSGMEI